MRKPILIALLITAPPGPDGCPALAAEVIAPWTAYLSTTGVYGDHAGRWVFEESDLRPQSPEALRRVQAEDAWREAARLAHRDLHIVRLPGLYGPGRSAFDRLRAGDARRIVRPGQVFSRLHADDAATALETLLTGGRPGDIWNLCDDEPAPNPDVITYAAGLLGVPPPPEELYDPQTAPPARRRFYAESKRVSNARAKAALGWRPQFRTYREGLAAILAAEGAA